MIEVLKQALEALKEYVNVVVSVNDPNDWRTVADGGKPAREAITSLRQAIAELESQYLHGMYAAEDLDKAWKSGYDNCKDQYAYLDKQEPVAWACRVVGGRKWLSIHASKGASDKWLEYRIKEQAQGEQYEQVKLHTHPPHRTWQGLTDEELSVCDEDGVILARYWEAKLKERNI
jgi:hypothetical protein